MSGIEKDWQSFRDEVGLYQVSESALAIARVTFYSGAAAMLSALNRPDTDLAVLVAEIKSVQAELVVIQERDKARNLTRY